MHMSLTLQDTLTREFAEGKTPQALNGFYRGELALLLPLSPLFVLAGWIARVWLPWRGKTFYDEINGDNTLSRDVERLCQKYVPSAYIGKGNTQGFHAFPFTTIVEQSMSDPIHVLRLDYDNPQNPPRVRTVVDELVQTKPDEYLGKAYLKTDTIFKLVAFFRLYSPHA